MNGIRTRLPHDEYFKKDVVIREIDLDQPCDACSDCSGFSYHPWRKTCSGCKCPREAHAIYHDEFQNVSDRLGFKTNPGQPQSANFTNLDPKIFNFSWAPPGLNTLAKIEEFYSSFPPEKVPRNGTPGERYRDKQLMLQLPKQDLALTYCKHVGAKHQSSYEDFVSARNEIALDIGYVIEAPRTSATCEGCRRLISPGRLCVTSSQLGVLDYSENSSDKSVPAPVGALWHPACFVCNECKEPLVDLAHCVYDSAIYCERHYAELLKPRCAACDEVSFSTFSQRRTNRVLPSHAIFPQLNAPVFRSQF